MDTIEVFGRRAIMVNDLDEAERFYRDVLCAICGGRIDSRYMRSTDEFLEMARRRRALQARRGAAAKPYVSTLPFTKVLVGRATILLYLLDHHVPQPPPEQLCGTPRLALQASPEQLQQAIAVLRSRDVPFEGPVEYAPPSPVACALYFKDPSGNFIELCSARPADGSTSRVRPV